MFYHLTNIPLKTFWSCSSFLLNFELKNVFNNTIVDQCHVPLMHSSTLNIYPWGNAVYMHTYCDIHTHTYTQSPTCTCVYTTPSTAPDQQYLRLYLHCSICYVM